MNLAWSYLQRIYPCVLGVCMIFGWTLSQGHEAIDLQLEKNNISILGDPENPDLYIERGLLYRDHGDVRASMDSLEKAKALDPDLSQLDYLFGQLLEETGNYSEALVYLDRFVQENPDNVHGKISKARALSGNGQFERAAQEYTEVVKIANNAGPDIYLERANALKDAGPIYYSTAIQGLDEGIEKFGVQVVLQIAAIDILRLENDWPGALDRVEILLAHSQRKERWLALKGDLLRLSGDRESASTAYLSALAAISTLPDSRRYTKATQKLTDDLRVKLK
jgi:tetratricopeptide (TPR) repeat protein